MRWPHINQEAFRQKKLRFMAHCHRAWSRNFVPLLLLILLQWPILIYGIYHQYRLDGISLMLFDSFLVISGCFIFVAMVEFVPGRKLRHSLLAFVLAIIASLFFLEAFAIHQYGMLFGEGLWTVILETNPAEASEYLYSVRHICMAALFSLSLLAVTGYHLQASWLRHGKRLPRMVLVFAQ